MNVLDVRNVTKRFGTHVASNNISLSVEQGRIFGFLGPNGAGKTTLIRMITNILIPDSGSITLFGEEVQAFHQNNIGYLPEERGLYKKLTVIEQIRYFGELKNLPSRVALERGYAWLEKMQASSWAQKKIQELSKGMSQKIQFITTVLHAPKLLILDEPFSGLDPVNTELFIAIIQELRQSGTTIILSTHVMEQVEKLCDDIVLINKGSIALSGSVRSVKSQFPSDRIIVEYDGEADIESLLPPHIHLLATSPNKAEFQFSGKQNESSQLLRILNEVVEIKKFEVQEPSLNEIFITTVQNDSTRTITKGGEE